MNDKWTKVNRVAVIVSFCVCVVGLLIVFVASLMDGYNMYWLFALSGIVSAVISHIMWAMYIEMSENIIHIASRNTRETDRTLSDISQTLGKILANMSNGGAVRPDTPWKCSCERSTLLTLISARTAALPEQTIFLISVYPVSGKKTGLLLQSLKNKSAPMFRARICYLVSSIERAMYSICSSVNMPLSRLMLTYTQNSVLNASIPGWYVVSPGLPLP